MIHQGYLQQTGPAPILCNKHSIPIRGICMFPGNCQSRLICKECRKIHDPAHLNSYEELDDLLTGTIARDLVEGLNNYIKKIDNMNFNYEKTNQNLIEQIEYVFKEALTHITNKLNECKQFLIDDINKKLHENMKFRQDLMFAINELERQYERAVAANFRPNYLLEDLVQQLCKTQIIKAAVDQDPNIFNPEDYTPKVNYLSTSAAGSLSQHLITALDKMVQDIVFSFTQKPVDSGTANQSSILAPTITFLSNRAANPLTREENRMAPETSPNNIFSKIGMSNRPSPYQNPSMAPPIQQNLGLPRNLFDGITRPQTNIPSNPVTERTTPIPKPTETKSLFDKFSLTNYGSVSVPSDKKFTNLFAQNERVPPPQEERLNRFSYDNTQPSNLTRPNIQRPTQDVIITEETKTESFQPRPGNTSLFQQFQQGNTFQQSGQVLESQRLLFEDNQPSYNQPQRQQPKPNTYTQSPNVNVNPSPIQNPVNIPPTNIAELTTPLIDLQKKNDIDIEAPKKPGKLTPTDYFKSLANEQSKPAEVNSFQGSTVRAPITNIQRQVNNHYIIGLPNTSVNKNLLTTNQELLQDGRTSFRQNANLIQEEPQAQTLPTEAQANQKKKKKNKKKNKTPPKIIPQPQAQPQPQPQPQNIPYHQPKRSLTPSGVSPQKILQIFEQVEREQARSRSQPLSTSQSQEFSHLHQPLYKMRKDSIDEETAAVNPRSYRNKRITPAKSDNLDSEEVMSSGVRFDLDLKCSVIAYHKQILFGSVEYAALHGHFITGGIEGFVQVWDAETKLTVKTFKAHNSDIFKILYLPDKEVLLTAAAGIISLWDYRHDFKPLGQFKNHIGPVYAMAFIPEFNLIVSGGEDEYLVMWAVESCKEHHRMKTGGLKIGSICYLRKIRKIAVGFDKGHVNIIHIDQHTRKIKYTLPAHSNMVFNLHALEDENILFSGSDDGKIKAWKIMENYAECLMTISQRTIGVTSFAVIPTSDLILANYNNSHLKMWRLSTGQLIGDFEDKTFGEALVYMKDRDEIITARQNEIKVWSIFEL